MLQKISRVVMTLACLVVLTAPAVAGQVTFTCTPGSFLSTLDRANFTGTGPWGEVCVTWLDDHHAFIQAETLSPFVMFSNAFGLEVNSQGFDILGGQGGIIAVGVGTSIDSYTAVPFGIGNS